MQSVLWTVRLHVHIWRTSSKDMNIPYAWAQCIWVLRPHISTQQLQLQMAHNMNTLPEEANTVCVVQLGMD